MKQLKFLRLFTCVSALAAMMLVSCTSTPQGESAQSAENWKPYDKNGEMIRTDRNATGKVGVVSTSKVEASRIGAEILRKGGNAIDAAVAAGFALGVVEPNSSGLGGGGFM